MSEFVVDKSSWHYRWIAWYWEMSQYDRSSKWRASFSKDTSVELYERVVINRPYNFCMYWRHVLLWPACRFVFQLVAWAILLGVLTMYITTAPWGFVSMLSFVFTTVALAVTLLAAGYGISLLLSKYRSNRQPSSRPSLFGQMYANYKDNYCPAVTYKVDNQGDSK